MLANLSLVLTTLLTLTSAAAIPVDSSLYARSKPTGGPAIATVTVYSSYTCVNPTTLPPTDGTAGAFTTVSIVEETCTVISVPVGAAVTARLTQTPKSGAIGCYVQLYYANSCDVSFANQFHGIALNGVTVGSTLGCANYPIGAYGAAEIVCV